LINNPPKESHCFWLGVKELLKEPRRVQRRQVRAAFSVLTKLRNPITRLTRINDLEKASGIKIGAPLIIHNPEIIGFSSAYYI